MKLPRPREPLSRLIEDALEHAARAQRAMIEVYLHAPTPVLRALDRAASCLESSIIGYRRVQKRLREKEVRP